MDIQQVRDAYPFLTFLRHKEHEHVTIVQNCDDKLVTFYDYASVIDEQRPLFLEMGSIWWFESNRQLPINIFLGESMAMFRYALRTANTRDIEVEFGPMTSLNNLIRKQIKRRKIQLPR